MIEILKEEWFKLLITIILGYLVKIGRANHVIMNSQRTAMIDKIDGLREHENEMVGKIAGLEEQTIELKSYAGELKIYAEALREEITQLKNHVGVLQEALGHKQEQDRKE